MHHGKAPNTYIVHIGYTSPVYILRNKGFSKFFRLSSSTRALASLGTHLNTHVVKTQLNHAATILAHQNCITTIPHYLEKYMKYIFSKRKGSVRIPVLGSLHALG